MRVFFKRRATADLEVLEIARDWRTGSYWLTLDEVLEELEAQLADDLASARRRAGSGKYGFAPLFQGHQCSYRTLMKNRGFS